MFVLLKYFYAICYYFGWKNTPSKYRHKIHFRRFLKKLTSVGSESLPINSTDYQLILKYVLQATGNEERDSHPLLSLCRGFSSHSIPTDENINNVSPIVIEQILRDLSHHHDKRFNNYYQYVYQITNKINRKPILSLNNEETKQVLDVFDDVYLLWKKHHHPMKSSFMSNANTLHICLEILSLQNHMSQKILD